MKIHRLAGLLAILCAGCSSIDPQTYTGAKPSLDVLAYFSGHHRGYGMVQDRSGKVIRRFVVDLLGVPEGEHGLALHESFRYADGELQTRVWHIVRRDAHRVDGRAGDVAGVARGEQYGNTLHWNYVLRQPVGDRVWALTFDDWMYLQDDGVMISRSRFSKFGIRLGELTLMFLPSAESPPAEAAGD